MKRINLSLILIQLISSVLLADEIDNLSMTDYKLTDTFFDGAYVNGQFSLKSPSDEDSETGYNGQIDAYYKLKNMTLDYGQDFKIDGTYNVQKGYEEDSESNDSYEITSEGHFDKYMLEVNKDFLLYAKGEFKYKKEEAKDDADDPFIQVGAGAGYGRIYNATPYAKAIRVLKDLKERNIITGTVTKEMALKLADLIAAEEEYVFKYSSQEYKKYWFNDISKLLKSTGATKDELNSFGIIRIEEILFDENIFPRYHGWIVRAGVGQVISNYNNQDEDPTLDAEFEYGLPIGLQSQFYENAAYSTILNGGDIGHTVTNIMTYSYELSDRVDWENQWEFKYYKSSGNDSDNFVKNTFKSAFYYYIANKLSFDTSVSLSKINDKEDGNDDLETVVFMGIRYRLK